MANNNKWTQKLRKLLNEFCEKNKVEEVEVYLFGSRAWGKPMRASDFDLVIKGPSYIISELREFLEESTFPYEVDVVWWEELSDELRKKILTQGEKWI
ncbi:nucleotidyltransferase family protein [Thermodesulfatator autotrophicus]|uniref:Polymerase nucleotidyl transferase domain-containing protein n=1 Tax=Thermodesulfatator autotrophicus TaxID=1795632 RepID=A0A177E545_9BACT|nr:nucleotidyltransferase domain-containing protein [Thermodesulfatator autotrophicus]OAG27093.1 hypothetical protein TH606_08855 [Thermodesulfatator autotrophicus]